MVDERADAPGSGEIGSDEPFEIRRRIALFALLGLAALAIARLHPREGLAHALGEHRSLRSTH